MVQQKSERYPNLFSPAKIGTMELSNRIVMAPMNTRLSESDGRFSLQDLYYYKERAKGGAGLIITGLTKADTVIEPFTPGVCTVSSPLHIPRLADMAELIHGFGAKLALQISAGHGRQIGKGNISEEHPPVSASSISYFSDPGIMCRELTVDEIKQIINACANTAKLASIAGVDAVEIHGHTGYLVDQFLSSTWNKRNDRYGGSLKERCTFALEIVEKIKEEVGSSFPVIFRISAEHRMANGRELDEALEIATILENGGYDALHCDAGCYDSMPWIFPPDLYGSGCFVELAKSIKKVVKIPVITVGNMGSPELAESTLREGSADLVALGRSLIADPEWSNKARLSKAAEIRPCLSCNEFCIGRIFQGKPISCAVNATAGKELFFQEQGEKNQDLEKVLVIGGGIAGMEAARVASLRGHTVKLVEKAEKLGGQLNAAGNVSFKSNVLRLKESLQQQLHKQDIDISLGEEATPDLINSFNPDHIIVATGASPLMPSFEGLDLISHQTAYDFHLKPDEMIAEGNVLVAGGGQLGCETALELALKGKKVTIVEMKEDVAVDLNIVRKIALLELLKKHNVTMMKDSKIIKFNNQGAVVETDGKEQVIPADKVVFALGSQANNPLLQQLQEMPYPFSVIGDCLEPGKISDAVHQGFHAGWNL